MRMLVLASVLLASPLTLAQSVDETAQDGAAGASLGSQLPVEVRVLLIEEMQAITRASQVILDALARGWHEIVEEQAMLIHDSFILEQNLTPEGREALEAAAPADFIERDEAFHELSASLADAARRRDHAEQRALFSQMIDACAECHALHAADRFPGLID